MTPPRILTPASARVAAWRLANPEKLKAQREKQYQANGAVIRARSAAWYEANKDQAKANSKSWREAHPDEMKAYYATWLAKPGNAEKAQGWRTAWMKTHRGNMQAAYKRWYVKNAASLRALQRHRAEVYARSDFTFDAWLEVLTVFDHKCAYCFRGDTPLTMDHVIALSRGGEHTAETIGPACKSCNSRKGGRPIFLMARFLDLLPVRAPQGAEVG